MTMTHPFDSKMRYELLDDGNIRVSRDGAEGIFTSQGVHVSGEIAEADPQMCVWVANVPNPDTQLATSRIAGRDDGQGL